MKTAKALYHRHRFSGAVISCAVRWYSRFQLSLRDIEELLLERVRWRKSRRSNWLASGRYS